jgi:hypothetical protein
MNERMNQALNEGAQIGIAPGKLLLLTMLLLALRLVARSISLKYQCISTIWSSVSIIITRSRSHRASWVIVSIPMPTQRQAQATVNSNSVAAVRLRSTFTTFCR